MALDPYRLPATASPTRYDLHLVADLEAGSFHGDVTTHLAVDTAIDELVCNAVDLAVDEAWVEPAGGGDRVAATCTLDPESERAHLALAATLAPGDHELHVRFRGELNDKLVGFYRSRFTDDAGVEHTIAVTQFEATHARRAFPCWDEPERKATLALTLDIPEGLTAVANSAVVSETVADGRRRIEFAETIAISTYIYAWVVGPLEATAAVTAGGTDLRIVHPPGGAALTAFALESGRFALDWFTAYYGLGYPGDKCDLVAVPDFAFGAMENLGCITFREALLLVDPERATQPELQRVADVIHHELAHMWFGDLVTMRWWNGIWLNEAFATFMEMKCTEAFRPQWDRWTDFGLSRTAAFDVDSLTSTRPIEFEVVSPQDAEGMFDILTYEKGAAVVRMLEQFLGEDAFRDGIRKYLTDNAYGNTETTDLWDALEAATAEPVRHIADTWIFQGGYPVVSAEVVDGPALRLRQQRLLFAGTDVEGGDETWAVPVLLRYGTGDAAFEDRVLLDHPEEDFALRIEPEWVQLNVGGSGFYRVRYSPAQLAALGRRLDQLTPLERYQLVDDAFASLLAGTTTAPELLDLVRRFVDDKDVSVWQRIAGVLGTLDRIVDDGARPRLQATIRALAAPALARMGDRADDGETDRVRSLRATLFELVGTLGEDESVLTRARALHELFVDDPEAVDPELAAATVNVIADHGGPDDFEAFRDRMRKADNPQEELRYLYALVRFRDRPSFEAALELAITEVRTQNAPFVLARALTNRALGPVAWEFIRRHWQDVNERFPTSTIVRMLDGVRALVDPAVAADVEAFFAEHEVPQGAKTLEQHLERLRVNVALRAREASRLAEALA